MVNVGKSTSSMDPMGNERLDDLAFLKDLGSFATHRLTLIMYDPVGNERLDDLAFFKDLGSIATHRLIIIYIYLFYDYVCTIYLYIQIISMTVWWVGHSVFTYLLLVRFLLVIASFICFADIFWQRRKH